MKNWPSKAELLKLAGYLEAPSTVSGPVYREVETLREASAIIRKLAEEQEPDKPKVEPLQESVGRLYARLGSLRVQARADALALVLRRVDRVWEYIQGTGRGAHVPAEQRAGIKQMLEGTE